MSQEAKFTKGPERWRAFESALQRGAWGIEEHVFGDNDPVIAPTRALDEETAKALAFLKNSHADMFEALEDLAAKCREVAQKHDYRSATYENLMAMANSAHAALAKARGQKEGA